MKKCLIIQYFGQWPEWIELFFYSCAQNTSYNFLIFTDCKWDKTLSSNIELVDISYADYCLLISSKIGVDFQPKHPYKLCDIRPFLGYIHSQRLKQFDFWGFCDIDLIFGDLSKFFPEKLFREYNVITSHADRIAGHFSLFRVDSKVTNLFKKNLKWMKLLNEQTNQVMDENAFSFAVRPETFFFQKIYSKIFLKVFNWRDAWIIYNKLLIGLNRLFCCKQRKLFFKEFYTTPILPDDDLVFYHDSESWLYQNGTIINNTNKLEYPYLHFMIFKKNSFRKDWFWKENNYNLYTDDLSLPIIIDKKGVRLK